MGLGLELGLGCGGMGVGWESLGVVVAGCKLSRRPTEGP